MLFRSIKALYDTVDLSRDKTSIEIQEQIDKLTADEYLDCDEKTGFALIEKKQVLAELEILKAATEKAEQEKIELEQLRKEQEARERKEREEAIAKKAADDARIAAEAKAAEAKAEADRLQRETAEAAEAAEREIGRASCRERG